MNVCETIADKLHKRASAQSSKRYLIVRKRCNPSQHGIDWG